MRRRDVFEKLDYADARFNELADKLFSSTLQNVSVRFLSATAATIISSCREVFDFAAVDIVEQFVAPHDKTVASGLISKKTKCYFPFYKSQLTRGDSPFKALKSHSPALHQYLFSLASAIEHQKTRPSTTLNYSSIRQMSDMVNAQKHDRLLEIAEVNGNMIAAKMPRLQLMLNRSEQRGVSHIRLAADAVHQTGAQYIFEAIGRMFLASVWCVESSLVLSWRICTQDL